MNYKVLNMSGAQVGEIALNPEIFAGDINPILVHDTVVWQRNKKRAGTHSALTKAEVSGGGKKPWKQKGTGRARAGQNTSPIWVGGGVAHGPKPRDYETRVPKRTRKAALISVLSEKVKNNELVILDSLDIASGKTKDMTGVIKALKLSDMRGILMLKSKEITEGVSRASRNIPGVEALNVAGINVYDLLKNQIVLTTKAGIEQIEARVNA